MASLEVDKIRNIAVVAHGGAGKTTLVEAMLFDSASTDRFGNVEDGTTTTDYEPEEIARKITITSSIAFCGWNGHRINLIDTPGFINFLEDTRGCLRAVDGAIVIVSAISGVKAETQKIWKYASEFEVPMVVFINKMDKETANFFRAVGELEKAFGTEALPLQVPIGSGDSFTGIVDLIKMKAFKFNNGKAEESDIPAEILAEVEEYRRKLVEKIAESDDTLLEKYLEGGMLSDDEIIKGVREGSLTKRFIPVTCGSAIRNIAVPQLLDTVLLCLPSPSEMVRISPIRGKNPKDGKEIERKPLKTEPLSAYVFKTIADPYAGRLSIFRVYSGIFRADSNILNATTGAKERIGQVFYLMGKKQVSAQTIGPGEIGVVAKLKETYTGDTLSDESHPIVFEKVKFTDPIISYAIAPKSKGDEDKVSTSLHRILEEDPTLRFQRDEETKEMLLSGMGQVHLEVTLERLKRKFGVEVVMKTPKVPYKETIKVLTRAQGRYKKQSGGRGQYGDCYIEIEPLPRGGGYEFVDKIVGGSIPRQYIPAVEKGIIETMHEGVIAGYPIVDLKVKLYDGSYHTVDSSEMAFKIAGSMALKKAIQDAKPVLLEPIMQVEVITPDDTLGSVIGDLNSKRGRVQGVEPQAGGNQKITSLVPMSEMLTYANQLHSLTSGRGFYSMEFLHYEELPAHLTQKIIAEREAQKKEKAEEK
ncbi:MAG: elongation factor G [Nitrospirae bacterium CG_4_10_14_0_8_um_filter_41_23]|nr:elongation factor G [Nitrospirota bacterium]OIP60961.1 MAG: translation elongation factor G [Nitrospirae bacterium CG2_30_41_42]PIQ93244.1 MAG: elongation factor G [Nitrospirae bacterium CG11_big_fil_rev_8_21_14_0_20_41_14]PIV43167.1 MAG: elongation factor G [Nitrospirae bacterium CG02_land_8_20_14_3_00_41_53]PIW87837.1 MAG: elongation factor G [Nitrospirae bacterium CG_4_8_14_3_um_filter_41_47]PIY87299.1 MAG: elongation factor G [Nitrospirae bacterium CG_4_10_14_0_8_um_filter_41_23]PJA798